MEQRKRLWRWVHLGWIAGDDFRTLSYEESQDQGSSEELISDIDRLLVSV